MNTLFKVIWRKKNVLLPNLHRKFKPFPGMQENYPERGMVHTLRVRSTVAGETGVRLELCCRVSLLGRGRVWGRGTWKVGNRGHILAGSMTKAPSKARAQAAQLNEVVFHLSTWQGSIQRGEGNLTNGKNYLIIYDLGILSVLFWIKKNQENKFPLDWASKDSFRCDINVSLRYISFYNATKA